MSIDKLEGIRSDLVRTDDDWQTWDLPKFVDALRKWTERNPLPVKVNDKNRELSSYPIYQTHQGDTPLHGIRSQGHRMQEQKKMFRVQAICDKTEMAENSMTAAQAGDSPVVYPVVVVELAGVKSRALLDSGAGCSYASAALIEQIGSRSHHSGMHKIEMMLGTGNRTMDIYRTGSSYARSRETSRWKQTLLKWRSPNS